MEENRCFSGRYKHNASYVTYLKLVAMYWLNNWM